MVACAKCSRQGEALNDCCNGATNRAASVWHLESPLAHLSTDRGSIQPCFQAVGPHWKKSLYQKMNYLGKRLVLIKQHARMQFVITKGVTRLQCCNKLEKIQVEIVSYTVHIAG